MPPAYILLILLGVAALPQSADQACDRFSDCMSVNKAVDGLARLAKRDWRHMTPAMLDADWPQPPVVAIEPTASSGLQAVFEAIELCCETCALCGAGPVMDEAPGRAGLRMVDMWICPHPAATLRASLQRLTQALLGADAKPNDVYRETARTIDWYSWMSNGELFSLRAESIESDGRWLAHVQAGRCPSEDVIDTWRIDSERRMLVTRLDVEPADGKEKRLWFAYFTRCLVHARGCQNSELDRVWPRIRTLAEAQDITRIYISPEDCTGRSAAFSLQRSPEGRWTGGLWSPKN